MSQIQIETLIRCLYCHDSIMEGGSRVGCTDCLAWHHADCLAELGRCGGCGAPAAPSLAGERARLDALLPATCVGPQCDSLKTILFAGHHFCRKHLGEYDWVLWLIALPLLSLPLAVVWVFLSQGRWDHADRLPTLIMATLPFVVWSGLHLWRRKRQRLALAKAEAEVVAEASAEADRPVQLLPKVAQPRKKLSA